MYRKHSNSKQQQNNKYSIETGFISRYRSNICANIWLKIKDTIWFVYL